MENASRKRGKRRKKRRCPRFFRNLYEKTTRADAFFAKGRMRKRGLNAGRAGWLPQHRFELERIPASTMDSFPRLLRPQHRFELERIPDSPDT